MKKKPYDRADGTTFWSAQNNIDDVLDTKRFRLERVRKEGHWFLSFKSLFGVRSEKEGKAMAKSLLERMLELMMSDMVRENESFIFPRHEFGYLRIGCINRYQNTDHMRFDVDYEGDLYGGLCILDPLEHKALGSRMFRFRVSDLWYKLIYELRATGHRWK